MKAIREQIERLREPGWVGKQFQLNQADTMEAMLEVVEAAEDIHKTLEHETDHVTALQTWRVGDALNNLKEIQ